MNITLADLNLTEKDFDVEVYFNTDAKTYTVEVGAVVNGVKCSLTSHISRELIQDMRAYNGFDAETVIRKQFKTTAIIWYINDIKNIRKLKLKRINEKIRIVNGI